MDVTKIEESLLKARKNLELLTAAERRARGRIRPSLVPNERFLKLYKSHERAVSKVEEAKEKVFELEEKLREAQREAQLLEHEKEVQLAGLARAPDEYLQNSKVYEDDEENIHVLLGYYDPEIGRENHGHWVLNRKDGIVYVRMPFAPHGGHNYLQGKRINDEMIREWEREVDELLASGEPLEIDSI